MGFSGAGLKDAAAFLVLRGEVMGRCGGRHGEWRMEDGGWRMGRWGIEDGGWRDGGWEDEG